MSEPSNSHGVTTATQAQTQESQRESPAPKWGEMPPPERISVLEKRMAEWEQLPAAARSDPAKGGGRNAFDGKGYQGGPEHLTGADVFYLAARALAASAEPSAIAASAAPLTATDRGSQLSVYLSKLHLEGAYLVEADLKGANLAYAHLEGANLSDAHLDGAYLADIHLEGAQFHGAHLEGAYLLSAHFDSAYLERAYLEGAFLSVAHFGGAYLGGARLERSDLERAHLGGANLGGASLEGANLTGASFDKTSRLNDVILAGATFDQVSFDNTNLTVLDWSRVDILGDERTARERKDSKRKLKGREERLDGFKAAVRANRVLAVALQAQGLSEDAARFAYRAQLLQRRVLRLQRRPFGYLFSLLIAALAGYGFRLWRIAAAYALLLLAFATAYFATGIITASPMPWYHALLISFTAIHGRVFLGQFGLDSPLSWIAGIEAVTGIVIEGVFVAMLIQRFFGR